MRMLQALHTGALLAQSVLSAATGHSVQANTTHLGPSLDRWPSGLHLAVDYYPSQWPESMWETEMARMRDANISYVRVNEFDWSILEPSEGQYNFTLLDRTLELCGKYGLKAIVGTPTATPPNWVTEKYDVDFVDVTNTTLRFGSRRHYSFSSFDYRRLSQGITTKLAERYGNNPNVVAWQLDNEFGCHAITVSYDHNAIKRFRAWLAKKYGTIENLNARQGRVFWSSQYVSFETVQPPFLEVYTTNEAHTLDWYTFSSDMVIEFAQEQTAILRKYSPEKAVTHNFMMMFTDFDHHKFAREVGIDFATFDQYALAGVFAFDCLSEDEMAVSLRQSLPDYQAMNDALYRGISGAAYGKNVGPFGVMEMKPGVLNWNQYYRVSPLEGMVRLWTHELFAASGDLVNYFRWRQVPFAQEQTLSALFTSDNAEDQGFVEQQILANEDLPLLRAELGNGTAEPRADVVLVFDYTSNWVWAIEPYSGSWDPKSATYKDVALKYTDLLYTFYSSLRRLGLSVDIIDPYQSLDGYKMVVVPSMPIITDAFDKAMASYSGPVIFGPHTGSKDAKFVAVAGLNPGNYSTLSRRLPMRVTRVETPPAFARSGVVYDGKRYNITAREEWIECTRVGADGGSSSSKSNATITYTSRHRPEGKPAACASGDGLLHYLAFNPPVDLLVAYLGDVAAGAGIRDLTGRAADKANDLGKFVRLLRRGNLLWAFNYGVEAAAAPEVQGATMVIGEKGEIPGAGLVVWKLGSGKR
ncbi:hypothetical protein PG996_011973 [Apiospora saccharicola]|uniref:beta-galactosidase n=1 Tax=Apiospora saccharicola TaxID=335842 RepID=A0ABR1U1T7_9PEZI